MRVRARSVSEGKRKCPGFRNTREIRFSLRVWMDVLVVSRLRNDCHAPVSPSSSSRLPVKHCGKRKTRCIEFLWCTCIRISGKMKSYILGKLNFCLEMEEQLRFIRNWLKLRSDETVSWLGQMDNISGYVILNGFFYTFRMETYVGRAILRESFPL